MSQKPSIRVVKQAPDKAHRTLPLLAIYASTLKARDDIADLAERGRWIMVASVADIFAAGLLVIVLVLEM